MARTFIVVMVLGLMPRAAGAQAPAPSFADLLATLKAGQTVVVTDATGRRTKGRVRDVSMSPPSLVIAGPPPRTFPEAAVAEIRTSDSLLNGALVGGGVGAGLALWDYLIDPSEPGNGAIFAVAIGLGTAIGAGIDKLIDGRRVLYRAGPRRASLSLAPLPGRHRRGVRLSVRF